jgi:predicted DsbA family dithiol-disulfide isomerase
MKVGGKELGESVGLQRSMTRIFPLGRVKSECGEKRKATSSSAILGCNDENFSISFTCRGLFSPENGAANATFRLFPRKTAFACSSNVDLGDRGLTTAFLRTTFRAAQRKEAAPSLIVKVTYYLEILSSWCYWTEPTWSALKSRYADRVEFQWKIALMNPGDFPVSRAQCDWFYRRSGTIMRSPFMLHSGWFEQERKGLYLAPNLVAEAGKDFGLSEDKLRLALSNAALREGRKIGGLDEAIAVAAQACGLDPVALQKRAESPEVLQRVQASTAEFLGFKISQRPAFLVEDSIGDRAVFSGLTQAAPLIATIDAMLSDAAGYATHAVHFGAPPPS